MDIIIDTHIFLWLLYEPQKVSKKHLKYLKDLDNTLYLTSISIAEIMIKKSLGNLDVEFDMFKVTDKMGLKILDFDAHSAMLLGTLPLHHRDPFDRMIISQSLVKKYKIITNDNKFGYYKCELL